MNSTETCSADFNNIAGPMMVLTQKLTALAFAVKDGREESKKKTDSKEQTELQIRNRVE